MKSGRRLVIIAAFLIVVIGVGLKMTQAPMEFDSTRWLHPILPWDRWRMWRSLVDKLKQLSTTDEQLKSMLGPSEGESDLTIGPVVMTKANNAGKMLVFSMGSRFPGFLNRGGSLRLYFDNDRKFTGYELGDE